jgi:hypothetical protein
MLGIKKSDVRRATLPLGSGNEGWLGFSPDGNRYHVVVPVDVQIARGVMACNRPNDGTPFGGYTGWLYIRCEPYPDDPGMEAQAREAQVRKNGENMLRWLATYQILGELVDEPSSLSE